MGTIIDYSQVLDGRKDGLVSREFSLCDDNFADFLAQSLLSMRLGIKPSQNFDKKSVRIQGNLCEFCIWELGENHWGIYKKINTTVANAKSPLIDHSQSGIDIVAIGDDGKTIYIIEVKSSQSDGKNLIFSNSSSLKTDFQHLFEVGAVEERIWGSITELIADLSLHGKDDIAEYVKNSVGNKPELCKGVKLIGVLVCQRSDSMNVDENDNVNAFARLHSWLMEQGWQAHQCEYHTIEIADFEKWLKSFIDGVTQ